MTISYKFTPLNEEGKQDTVIKIDSAKTQKTFIPFNPDNTDYQDYLKWVAEGNTAAAADTPTLDQQWAIVRADRDQRLAETDWTQGSDVPNATKTKWQTYRQDLRDIPQKQTDPTNITWPTKPS